MKKLLSFLPIIILLSCSYDDDNVFAPKQGTDFNKDISNKTNFYFSTPVEIKVLDNEYIGNNLDFKVGDTLKLELKLRSIFQENATDFYDLYQSTQSEEFVFKFNIYDYSIQKTIDLALLEKNPEINSMSDIEIRTHPVYKYLFIRNNEVKATYNSDTKEYISKIGIVLSEKDTISNNYISISPNITNYSSPNNIYVFVPIISVFDDVSKQIRITD
ncbi:hypothetical protein [Ochrovirga pacifica]|uniref:hypothetical protein n=1 Tax=Ochrovirga pacifica TaxID=1042376 RepID=UPI000255A4DF|nr:hypothetical protein [Ochrovirga pacifica]